MKKRNFLLFLCIFANLIAHAQETSFEKYLDAFVEIDNISNGNFLMSSELDPSYHKTFLPIAQSPCKSKDGTTWSGVAKWKSHGINVVYAVTYYDSPCDEEGYPWYDGYLVSYDKSGKIIDYILLTRYGDRYDYTLYGNISPTLISVCQATVEKSTLEAQKKWDKVPCELEFFNISMDKKGYFGKDITKPNESANLVWNKESNNFRIEYNQ